jgi:hypothetical protein
MAYEFNGTNQYLKTASTPVTAAPLTLAAWFYPDTDITNYVIMGISDGTTSNRFVLAALGGVVGKPVRLVHNGTSGGAALGEADSSIGFVANTWQHACGVLSSSTSRAVYLNGGNSTTNTNQVVSTGLNSIDFGFRLSVGVPGLFLDGRLAEVGIWNAALTAAEISSLAKGMTCDKIRPQSLVFYAPLVRDLIDQKGGLTITNNNAATVSNHPRVYA